MQTMRENSEAQNIPTEPRTNINSEERTLLPEEREFNETNGNLASNVETRDLAGMAVGNNLGNLPGNRILLCIRTKAEAIAYIEAHHEWNANRFGGAENLYKFCHNVLFEKLNE